MLLNLSNHASNQWSPAQIQAAQTEFGDLRDLPFPAIAPSADFNTIIALAQEYVQKCQTLIPQQTQSGKQPATSNQRQTSAIHIMGEMTFVYQFVKRATAAGLRCVASTTERRAVDHPDGSKTSEFRFVRFRDYEQID